MADLSLIELRVLDCAARTGSLSGAARELGVSQQATSARLRALERAVGLELVRRSPAGVVLTEAGETVLVGAREVLAAAARLDTAAAELRGERSSAALRVAASQTIAAHLLPSWIVELRRSQTRDGRPGTAIELHTANSNDVIAMVRDGAADLGFIEQPDPPRDLASTVVRRDRMVVAVAPAHPWAGGASIPLAEVAAEPLVAREIGSGTRAAFEAAVLRELGRAPAEPLLSLATEAAVRSAVAQGVAPAVLSELTVRDDVRLGRIRALGISPHPVTRPLAAVWRGSRRDLIGAARELVSLASAASTPAPVASGERPHPPSGGEAFQASTKAGPPSRS